MTAVARLVTLVDLGEERASRQEMSLSARHEAVLGDGRHLLLLDDRGWSSSLEVFRAEQLAEGDSSEEDLPDIWSLESVEDIEETARVVVGPDEPFEGRSQEDMEASHWDELAGILRRQGSRGGPRRATAASPRRRAQRAGPCARRPWPGRRRRPLTRPRRRRGGREALTRA